MKGHGRVGVLTEALFCQNPIRPVWRGRAQDSHCQVHYTKTDEIWQAEIPSAKVKLHGYVCCQLCDLLLVNIITYSHMMTAEVYTYVCDNCNKWHIHIQGVQNMLSLTLPNLQVDICFLWDCVEWDYCIIDFSWRDILNESLNIIVKMISILYHFWAVRFCASSIRYNNNNNNNNNKIYMVSKIICIYITQMSGFVRLCFGTPCMRVSDLYLNANVG